MSTRPTQKPVPRPVSQANKKPVPNPNTSSAKKPAPRAPAPQTKSVAPTQKPVQRAPAPQKPKAPSQAPAKKPPVSRAPAPRSQPPSEPKAGNWINRTVQERVAGVGSWGAGYVNQVGDAVNGIGAGIGSSITNTARYWGQGVAGYGNDLKDTVGAGGPRVPVAGNPLGLGGMGSAKGALPGGKEAQPATRNAGKRTGAGNPLGI